MKRETAKWVRKAEQDWEAARKLAAETPPPRDVVCFHCQQAAEKYLKALLQENGLVVPKTHQLDDPGLTASKRQMEAALRQVDRIRMDCRGKLNLALS